MRRVVSQKHSSQPIKTPLSPILNDHIQSTSTWCREMRDGLRVLLFWCDDIRKKSWLVDPWQWLLCFLPVAGEKFEEVWANFASPTFETIPPPWYPPFFQIFFYPPFLKFLKIAIPPFHKEGVRTMVLVILMGFFVFFNPLSCSRKQIPEKWHVGTSSRINKWPKIRENPLIFTNIAISQKYVFWN